MKKFSMKKKIVAFVLMMSIAVGCGREESNNGSWDDSSSGTEEIGRNNDAGSDFDEIQDFSQADATQLQVGLGDGGEMFTMQLEDNDTARAVAYHVGTSDWRLPIYNYDDFEGWSVTESKQ